MVRTVVKVLNTHVMLLEELNTHMVQTVVKVLNSHVMQTVVKLLARLLRSYKQKPISRDTLDSAVFLKGRVCESTDECKGPFLTYMYRDFYTLTFKTFTLPHTSRYKH